MAEKVNLDNAVDWNDYGVSVEGQPQVKVSGYQEIPDFADYGYSVEGYKAEDKPVMTSKPMGTWEKAKSAVPYAYNKVKQALAYAYDPITQEVIPEVAKKVYAYTHGEEYDPKEVADYDVDRAASIGNYKPYVDENLEDYAVRRRDMKPMTEDVMAGRANVGQKSMEQYDPANDYANFTDTELYRQGLDPENYVGAVAKGVGGYVGDELPRNLEMLATEKGIEGGAKMLGTLSPVFKELKQKYQKTKDPKMFGGDEEALWNDYAHAKGRQMFHKDMEEINRGMTSEIDPLYRWRGEQLKAKLTPEEFQATMQQRYGLNPTRAKYPVVYDTTEAAELERIRQKVGDRIPLDDPAVVKSLNRNANRTPKPLPNPAAQRAEALRRNARPTADLEDAIQRAKNIVQDYGYEGESINKALENAIANRLANLTAEEISNYSLRPNTTDTAIYVANKAVEDLMDSGVIR